MDGALCNEQLRELSVRSRSNPTQQIFYIVAKNDGGNHKYGEMDSRTMKFFCFTAPNDYWYFDNYWFAWACSQRLLKLKEKSNV